MALGAITHIATSQTVGARTVRFSMPLTSGANHVVEGSTIDLSAATLGAYRGLSTRCDGLKFCGWLSAATDPAANIGGFNFEYLRAAAGDPATGVLKITGVGVAGGANAGVAFDVLAVNDDMSALTGLFEAVGV